MLFRSHCGAYLYVYEPTNESNGSVAIAYHSNELANYFLERQILERASVEVSHELGQSLKAAWRTGKIAGLKKLTEWRICPNTGVIYQEGDPRFPWNDPDSEQE